MDDLVSTSSPKRGARRRAIGKSVRFRESNQFFPIPHLNDLSDEDIAEIWYEPEDYSEIKSSYQLTIFMMESNELVESDDHTARGLEYRTQQGAWSRYENKRDAYNAVLDEQDRQWKVDKDDHEKISQIYLEHSTKCARAAADRGAADAKEAKDICQDLLRRRKLRRKKSKRVGLDASTTNSPIPRRTRDTIKEKRDSAFTIDKQEKAIKKDRRLTLAV